MLAGWPSLIVAFGQDGRLLFVGRPECNGLAREAHANERKSELHSKSEDAQVLI